MQIFGSLSWLRHAVAAIYAMALLLGSPGICGGSAEAWRAPAAQDAQLLAQSCHDQAKSAQNHRKDHGSCCGACTVTAAARLDSAHISSLVLRIEIATRFDFKIRLGDDLDNGPGDLRSRAPPHIRA